MIAAAAEYLETEGENTFFLAVGAATWWTRAALCPA